MSQKRTQKLKQAKAKQNRLIETQNKKVNRFLEQRGLLETYREVPSWIREQWRKKQELPPRVDTKGNVPAEAIARVRKWLSTPLVPPDFTLADYHVLLGPLIATAASPSLTEEARTLIKTIGDELNKTMDKTIDSLIVDIMNITKLDGPKYWLHFHYIRADRTRLHATIIRADLPKKRMLIDGSYRPVYQVTEPYRIRMGPVDKPGLRGDFGKVTPILVPPDKFGRAPGPGVPVFLSSHAIRRLHERLDHPVLHESLSFMVYHTLDDLHKPRPLLDGAFMVPIHLDKVILDGEKMPHNSNLGYLVLNWEADELVVRTFKFVTMDGTPEARCLRSTLRLRRPDINYYQLDRFSTLMDSDLIDQAELRRAFGKCGMESLFKFVEYLRAGSGHKFGIAEDLMKHLNIDGSL